MSTLLDLFDNSSDSEEDTDYVPPAELIETSGDEAESSDENTQKECEKVRKRAYSSQSRKVKKKVVEETEVETPVVDQKQRANDLWKDFLDEVSEVKSESAPGIGSEASSPVLNSNKKEENGKTPSISSVNKPEKSSELLLTFAGEVVSDVNDDCVKPCANSSSECDFLSKNPKVEETETSKKEGEPSATSSGKRKGLNSVLDRINKKQKNITTLEKTLIDWKSFKKDEGIEEDVEKYNKGKGGFIERQRFLERSDLRRFEIEKTMRLSRTRKS